MVKGVGCHRRAPFCTRPPWQRITYAIVLWSLLPADAFAGHPGRLARSPPPPTPCPPAPAICRRLTTLPCRWTCSQTATPVFLGTFQMPMGWRPPPVRTPSGINSGSNGFATPRTMQALMLMCSTASPRPSPRLRGLRLLRVVAHNESTFCEDQLAAPSNLCSIVTLKLAVCGTPAHAFPQNLLCPKSFGVKGLPSRRLGAAVMLGKKAA